MAHLPDARAMGVLFSVAVLIAVGALLGARLRARSPRAHLPTTRATGATLPALEPFEDTGPGAHPAAPIQVPSPAVIEPTGAREPCPRCGDRLRVTDHRALATVHRRLRALDLRCTGCGLALTRYFELAEAPRPN